MKLLPAACLALFISACSTTNPPVVAVPTPKPPTFAQAPVSPQGNPATAVPVAQAQMPIQEFRKLQADLDGNSLFFDYDSYDPKPGEDSVIMEHAKLATEYPADQVTIAGNCDERGGREYNLALGQRRADTVKRLLVLEGVPPARIQTVSYGKEKPRESCHQEKCWSENRRADFIDQWK